MTMEWQDMKTAPKDGSKFLAFEYDSDGSPAYYSCYYHNGWFFTASIGDSDYFVDPSHWKPHDDPPTAPRLP